MGPYPAVLKAHSWLCTVESLLGLGKTHGVLRMKAESAACKASSFLAVLSLQGIVWLFQNAFLNDRKRKNSILHNSFKAF